MKRLRSFAAFAAALVLAACAGKTPPPQIAYDSVTAAVPEPAPAKPVRIVKVPEPLPLRGLRLENVKSGIQFHVESHRIQSGLR